MFTAHTDRETSMIVVNAIIESTAENIAGMKAAIATMETASRAEDGCDDYTFSIELNNPDVLRITEKWRSMEDLTTHFATPHMASFQAAMAAHPPKNVSATFYEANEIERPAL